MSYWEFLIQRENDRAWRPLTSRNLQILEGNYRIIANTSVTNSTVRTQVFHQTNEQPPQLSQNRSQSTSNEGLLVVLPFTHLQPGTWHLNCNVTNPDDSDIHEKLCLKVISRPAGTPVSISPGAAIANDHIYPDAIMAAAVSNLDVLLADIAPATQPPLANPPAIPPQTAADILDLSVIPDDDRSDPSDPSDPFAAALQIALRQREDQQADKLTIEDDRLQEFLAVTDLEFSVLDPDDLPMNSYDINSYEVVVD
jgi:hypothetical protein